MTGYGSIDISITKLWRSFCEYQKGKKRTYEFVEFKYNLELELFKLHEELRANRYQPGVYRHFEVTDNKKRTISVAPLRDKIIHRLIYDYLVEIYDKNFVYDAWSCRKGKGLHKAIERTQSFLRKYPDSYVWRSDVKKFFDSVNQNVLLDIIEFRIKDGLAINLIAKVIKSYDLGNGRGMPIGNLTSQIFANIYLNEFDHYVKHNLKPLAYLRYGDDFIILADSKEKIEELRSASVHFLNCRLNLQINAKNDIIIKAKQGLHFLGSIIYAHGRKLSKRNKRRIAQKLNFKNIPSYYGIIKPFGQEESVKFCWQVIDVL
ncbi:MAG: reverse transcriptase/maturase family protein [Candidatus Parcubacteria bacterium]|nr:reverse transcriptase/maturase family protein [Candidatus Parcubacteria bacterium]